jgi:hypothetical protein
MHPVDDRGQRGRLEGDRAARLCRRGLDGPEGPGPGGRDIRQRPVLRGTESFSTPANVGRLVNLTQRKYAYMRPGPGFHGSLANVDLSGDPSIDHISIDKSARLHARAISEVLAVVKGHRVAGPNGPIANPTREETGVKVAPDGGDFAKPVGAPAPSVKSSNDATNSTMAPLGESAPSLSSPQDARRPKAIAPAKLPD